MRMEIGNWKLEIRRAAVLAGLAMLAHAYAEPPAPHTVVVPYDSSQPLENAEPKQFYLDYETFQELWARAKEHRMKANTPVDPAFTEKRDFAVVEGLHEAEILPEAIRVRARYTLHTRGPDWIRVPFKFEGASVRSVVLDGAAAALENQHLLIEKAGRHLVEVNYEVAAAENWEAAGWKFPAATAGRLAVKAPDERSAIRINGRETGVAALGNRGQVELKRTAKPPATAKLQRPRLARFESVLTVESGVERLASKIELRFPGAEMDRFRLLVDGTFTPSRVEVPNLAEWRLSGSNPAGLRTFQIQLEKPAKDGLAFVLEAERLRDFTQAERIFPRFDADAQRVEQIQVLAAKSRTALSVTPPPGHRRVAFDRSEGSGFAFEAAGSAEDLRYRVEPRLPKRSAKAAYVFEAGPRELETIATLELTSEVDLLQTTLQLPPQMTIQDVSGPFVADWWRTGDDLHLRLKPSGGRTVAVLVHLVREFPGEQTSLSLSPILTPDFADVSGSAIVVTHAGNATVLRFDENRRVVREVAAGTVNREFEILPPVVRRHGFTFDQGEFSATLELDRLTPQFDSEWVLYAQVFDTRVGLTYLLDVEVKEAALGTVSFELPASVPEARVRSEELREVRTEVVGEVRRYAVTFQRDVVDVLNFTIQTELPLAGGEVSLPNLGVPDARRLTRYLVVESHTADQLSSQRTGVETAPRSEVPYLPQTLLGAQFYRAAPGFTFALSTEKLETSAGNEAIIAACEMTTALRENGEEWHRAVFRLLNRRLQFLPVRLPPGAELIAARVGENEVRADRGEVDGRAVLLVPLIQTRPGEVATQVELIYRRRGNSRTARRSFERSLEAPELAGFSAEQTVWDVHLPPNFRVSRAKGNVREISGDERVRTQILRNMAEAERLLKLARDNPWGDFDNSMALQNAQELAMINKPLIEANRKAVGDLAVDNSGIITKAGNIQEITTGDITVSQAGQEIVLTENRIEIVERNQAVDADNAAQIGHAQQQLRLNDNISVGNKLLESPKTGEQAPQPPNATPQKKGKKDADFEFSYAQIGHGGVQMKGDGKKSGRQADGPFFNKRAQVELRVSPGHGQVTQIDVGGQQQQLQQGQQLAGAIQPAQKIRPKGRVSLRADFPLSGNVSHYRKVKGDARLKIRAVEAADAKTGWAWVWFGIALLGILGIGQLGQRRS